MQMIPATDPPDKTNQQSSILSCEDCPAHGEYLCVGCDRHLCQEHYIRHECSGPLTGGIVL